RNAELNRPSAWAARTAPEGWAPAVAAVAWVLELSRWQARRVVKRSRIARLWVRRWRFRGRPYSRRLWVLPPGGLEAVCLERIAPSLARDRARLEQLERCLRRRGYSGAFAKFSPSAWDRPATRVPRQQKGA